MNTSFKHYICGFNGFRQVDLFLSHTETLKQESHPKDYVGELKRTFRNDVKNPNLEDTKEKPKLFHSVPQEVGAEIKLCTWSDIWTISDSGKIGCYGDSNLQVKTELQSERRDLTVALVHSGKNILLQEGFSTLLIQDTGLVSKLTTEVEHVSLVDATRDSVYGIKDGQCFEGQVQKRREEQALGILCLHPITVNMDVQTVSCGFEHTLILTRHNQVYSYGSGSRGQLGHGEVTVDLLQVPRCVDTFNGISVVAIAAGGWHSTAVTDTGDVYVWGWNESGQLGLPNGTISSNRNLESDTFHTGVQILGINDKERETDNWHSDNSKTATITTHKAGIVNEAKAFGSEGCKRKFEDIDEGNVENNSGKSNLTENLDKDCKRKLCNVDEGNIKNKSSQSNLTEILDIHEFAHSRSCKNVHDPKETECVSSSAFKRHFPDCTSEFEASDSNCVQLKFPQDIDSGQVQTVPYGLALPDEMHVKTASCGTRHTCILTDSGVLLTTGWNAYGQLCHGDTDSRDYLEIVTFFTKRKEQILNVKAQCWNTYIKTEKQITEYRGQLGHGEVTVDLLQVPRCVDTFNGISVVAIAAGGWHSTAVTDTGDVYVWGWNESGQLGLPNGTISSNKNLESDTFHTGVQILGIIDKERETDNWHSDNSKTATITTHKAGIVNEAKAFGSEGCKRKFEDIDEGNVENKSGKSNLTENLDKDYKRKLCDIDEGNIKNKSSQSNLTEILDIHEFAHSRSCKNVHDPKETECVSSSAFKRHFPDCTSEFEAGDSNCVQLTFPQDIDSGQVQTVPYGLALPDEMHVKTASCGTRHTCILTDSGVLLTTGWNAYGQLCHGDTDSRDYLEIVTFFTKRKEQILNVKAQCWNTYIKTEKQNTE